MLHCVNLPLTTCKEKVSYFARQRSKKMPEQKCQDAETKMRIFLLIMESKIFYHQTMEPFILWGCWKVTVQTSMHTVGVAAIHLQADDFKIGRHLQTNLDSTSLKML